MTPKEWAKYFRDKHPNDTIEELATALLSASKYGFWASGEYAEIVIKELKKIKTKSK